MRPPRPRALLTPLVIAATLIAGGATCAAEGTKPQYLPYVAFTPDDTAQRIALKEAYNQAVRRYNETLYDYHVTLERHDQAVERHNTSTDPAERQKAREEAAPLRARLATLRGEVSARAAAVDQAASRAAAGGVLDLPLR